MATILLVDDDEDLRHSLRPVLEAEGHRIVDASDGAEAMHCWRSLTLDLIITDFWMPGLNGVEVIQAVFAQQPDMPIILMSGCSDADWRQSVRRQFPSIRVLSKPFDNAQLRQVVRDSLSRAAQAAENEDTVE